MNETMSLSDSGWAWHPQQILSASGQGLAASSDLPNTAMGTATTINNSSGGMTREGRVSKSSQRCGTTQENRIFKPIQKRSRVSRQTQTSLLRTTATNFKAMVQQFTGYPVSPFAPIAPFVSTAHVNLGLTNRQPIADYNAVIVARAGYTLAQLEQQRRFRNQQCILPVNINGSVGGKNALLQGPQSLSEPVMMASAGGLGMDDSFSPLPPSFNREMSPFSYIYM
ncbi:uncharacterized protein LOC141698310 isoform X1 [Apium graveolens]|uniref:uncharacterized protein LOC141698310 isoform X1 n=1 Tax=Apium graveolens TaxID=4045 RepID=UPI003D79637E